MDGNCVINSEFQGKKKTKTLDSNFFLHLKTLLDSQCCMTEQIRAGHSECLITY